MCRNDARLLRDHHSRHTTRATRLRPLLACLPILIASALPAGAVVAPTPSAADTVVVQVVNALSQQPLVGLNVTAKRRVGDRFESVTQRTTDGTGQAVFQLAGLSSGVAHAFFAQPYNGGWVQSPLVTAPGSVRFAVGRVPVLVVAGGTGAPLAATTVTLKEKLADGTLKWAGQGATDATGMITFDPPGLDAGRTYVLEAASPWDRSVKRSNPITGPGALTFVVGNAPLNVTLVDARDLTPLPGLQITVYERLSDGTVKWTKSQVSDAAGGTVFDLTGLGSGRVYFLRVQAFNGGSSESEDLTAPGNYVFKIGTLTVDVVAGGTLAPLPGLAVTAYERLADGKLKWAKQGATDATGRIRFDLPGLGAGRAYVLRAASPWDGSVKTSNNITQPGALVFPVGSAPLNVTLLNGLTRATLPGLKITASERLADGRTRWTAERTTDATGTAVFDLDGLGDGRVYFLSARPYNGGTAYSPDLTAAGDYEFRVGVLEVTAVKGGDGSPLVNSQVILKEKLASGALQTVASGLTDANAIIRFDPPGLGAGRTYQLEAKSPVDASIKRSDLLTAPGRYTFTVGNAPLSVTLLNALSGDPLAAMKITASERQTDGRLRSVATRVTNAAGQTAFDLPGLGSGKVYVLSTVPYTTGTVYSDDIRAPGPYEFRVGTVEVTVVNAATGQPLPSRKVNAKEKRPDGTLVFVAQGTTDALGVIRFDLPGLKTGKIYILEAASPVDGSIKRSQDITAIGKYEFRVGNIPLDVTLRNALSGVVLPGISVTVRERAGTSLRWVRQLTTDGAGQARFDLDGLGSGRIYVLSCEPYNGGVAESGDITKPGLFDFLVGGLEVAVVSGATGGPLVDSEVAAYEVLSTGKRKWMRAGRTDQSGIIRFDLPGLGSGRTYLLEGHSPIDQSHKYSEKLTQSGRITFVVGGKPLRVTVVDGVTSAPLADAGISAYEVLPTGDRRWASWTATDASGGAVFDLDGLGSGRVYALATDPYEAGGVETDPLTAPADILLRVGTIPLTLIDGDNNVPLAGVSVTAYEKLATGALRWAKQATTDAAGTIRFDLEGVSRTTTILATAAAGTESDGALEATAPVAIVPSGEHTYVFQVCNPFAVSKRYWSPLVTGEGPVEFRITRAGEYPLDVTPPTLRISTPASGANVDATGFVVSGFAADNATLTQVLVTVTDPVKGVSTGAASYDAATGRWSVAVPENAVTAEQLVTVTIIAIRQARNQATATLTVRAIIDASAPQVTVTSHTNGDEVEKTGFLLAGTAVDDIGVTSLRLTVDDPVLGRTVDQQPVGLTPGSSAWTYTVLNGQITQGQTIRVTLAAQDAKGNTGTASLTLLVVAVDFEGTHLINRITFGATPALTAEVASIGADAFVTQQLNPASIDDATFTAMMAARPRPTTVQALQTYELLHAIYSRRQLQEVLGWFWDNHFNTDIGKSQVVAYELAENDAFRQNALGRFRDLLDVTARSPAMLIYLDNATSMAANPNENWARELLELYTLGVDGGYTQRDVEAVARAFTGWQVSNGQFAFNAANHDTGTKIVLGQTLPANRGIEDGVDVLNLLAAHPSTAHHICTKLAQLLVSDAPPAALVDRCTQTFLGTGGQIGAVVQGILRSPEFGDPTVFRAKIKTPLEFVVGTVRNVGATPGTTDLVNAMSDMGMRLFQDPVPTGWSETGDDWMNSNTLIQRMQFVNRVAATPAGGSATGLNPRTFFATSGFATADGIVGFLFQMLFHHDYTPLDRQVALDILTNNGTEVFDINAPTADARLRRLLGTVMSYPGYEFQ